MLNGILWIPPWRSPVGGLVGPVSLVPNVPSAVPTLGAVGVLRGVLAVLARRSTTKAI